MIFENLLGCLVSGLSGIFMLLWIPYTSVPSIYENFTVYLFHFVGCMAPFLGSTIYHLFMCHKSGGHTYDRLLKFDMCGIWAINTFGGISAIKATLFCSLNLSRFFILSYILTAFVILYFVLTAKNVRERFKPLLLFGIFRYSFLAGRGIMLRNNLGAGEPRAIIYYILMDLAALIGGILNVSRFPEQYIPGKFDFCFNSHNIMHVVVTLCPVLLHWGTMLDFNWMAKYQC